MALIHRYSAMSECKQNKTKKKSTVMVILTKKKPKNTSEELHTQQ